MKKLMHSNYRLLLSLILLIVFAFVSIYIKKEIDAYNMLFYAGKDDGAFVQFESIVIFGSVSYFLLAKKHNWLFLIIGFVLSCIVAFLMYLLFETTLFFPIISSMLLLLLVHLYWFVTKK